MNHTAFDGKLGRLAIKKGSFIASDHSAATSSQYISSCCAIQLANMSSFDPLHKWLGIPPAEQPPNHYRLLGVSMFESNLEVIDNAAIRQIRHVRTFANGKHKEEANNLLNRLSLAQLTLLDEKKKEAYDASISEDGDENAAQTSESEIIGQLKAEQQELESANAKITQLQEQQELSGRLKTDFEQEIKDLQNELIERNRQFEEVESRLKELGSGAASLESQLECIQNELDAKLLFAEEQAAIVNRLSQENEQLQIAKSDIESTRSESDSLVIELKKEIEEAKAENEKLETRLINLAARFEKQEQELKAAKHELQESITLVAEKEKEIDELRSSDKNYDRVPELKPQPKPESQDDSSMAVSEPSGSSSSFAVPPDVSSGCVLLKVQSKKTGNEEFKLEIPLEDEFRIGRSESFCGNSKLHRVIQSDLVLSGKHLIIEPNKNEVAIQDVSRNGTKINDELLKRKSKEFRYRDLPEGLLTMVAGEKFVYVLDFRHLLRGPENSNPSSTGSSISFAKLANDSSKMDAESGSQSGSIDFQ